MYMVRLIYLLNLDVFLKKLNSLFFQVKLYRYEKASGQKINFVMQGGCSLSLLGDLTKFKIHETSHLKSDTLIECSGRVEIGRYFHSGKGLTVFSANHNWKGASKIPYDESFIEKPVLIHDFVWCGANVTILPGVVIGEGVIIGGGSVVTKNVAPYTIVGGNPARKIGERDVEEFLMHKNNCNFF